MPELKPHTVSLTIARCKDCPNLHVGRLYSLDGFDRGCDWTCTAANNRAVASFVEWPRDEPKTIPRWCPLRSKPSEETSDDR